MSTPLSLPTKPFTSADLDALGMSRSRLRRLCQQGEVRRVVRGVYVPADLADSVELRARAVGLVMPPHHVVRDRTAAWLHRIDTLTYAEHDVIPPVETCAIRGMNPNERSGVDGRTRDLAPHDVMELHGLRTTTQLRTALDLGCLLRRREALAALDAFARLHGVSQAQLATELPRYRRRRGVIQLRELIPLVDSRAESARESWTRLAIRDAGLPEPEVQYWIVEAGVRLWRLDLAYPASRIAVEYDGLEHHERAISQVEHDDARRRWLTDHGWTVIVVRRGDFTGTAMDNWLTKLREALRPTYTNVRRLERGSRQTAWT